MFRQLLMGGASRLFAPENDDGFEVDDGVEDFDPALIEDDGEVEDEPDDADESDLEDDAKLDDPEPEPARRPSRGENRVAAATRAAAEAKADAAAARRELEAFRAERNQPPRETQAQLNERLAQMEPWERTEFFRQQDRAEMAGHLQRIEFNANESADKTAYAALAARVPAAAKYAQDVEDRLASMRSQGTTAPRETVLRWVIGDKALANATRATGKAKKSADANRDRQTARPGSGRGDAAPSDRRDTRAARDKRLENMNI